jgi:uncharacterized alpha-E superfamily protein
MLSRTADGLFWLARYMERAENVARIVSAGTRMAGLTRAAQGPGDEWRSMLIATGCEPAFQSHHPEVVPADVIEFLVRDPNNPSSIVSCFETARANARAVRTALTADMWDALNDTWLELRTRAPGPLTAERLPAFLDWVKQRSFLFSGAYGSTMLRNDAYWFTRLGTFLERADATARILDVKYHVLLQADAVGGEVDYHHWQSILRAVSGLRAYHWVFHERLRPWLVAELLILRPEMPRSLLACCTEMTDALDRLAEAHGGRRAECHRRAGALQAQLRYGRIDTIYQSGLHEFLTDFIDQITLLGQDIDVCYLAAA